MAVARGLLRGVLGGMVVASLAVGTAGANGKAIEWSTKSREARELVVQITRAIETYQSPAVLTGLAQRLVDADPDWGFAYMVQSQFQAPPQAQASLDKAKELSTGLNEGERTYVEGAAAIRAQDIPKALAAFQKLVRLYPGERRAHMLVGQLQMGAGDFAAAEKALKKAFKMDSSTPRIYAFLGNCRLIRGSEREAQKYFRAGLQKVDESGAFPFGLYFGSIFSQVQQRHVDQALASVDLALRRYIDSGGPQGFPAVFIHNLRARINLENGRLEAALRDYENGAKTLENVDPAILSEQQKQIWTGRYHHGRARTLAKMGKFDQAMAIAEELKRQIDGGGQAAAQFVPSYHYLAGYIQLEAGKLDKAIDHLESANAADPFHRVLLARAYFKKGSLDKAREIYREVAGMNQVSVERALAYPEAKEMLKKLGKG